MSAVLGEHTQWHDISGKPFVAGKVFFGTQGQNPSLGYPDAPVNLITIYSDRALQVPISNPQIIDSKGRTTNKIYVTDKYAIEQWDSDDNQKYINLDVGKEEPIEKVEKAGTMADLLLANIGTDTVILHGFHTAGDGGGGEFFYDSTEPRSNHNGGTIIDPTNTADLATWDASAKTTWFTAGSGSGCWIRLYEGNINAKMFGAKGDNSEDDTKSFTAVEAHANAECDLADGTYLVTGLTLTKTYRGPGIIKLNTKNQFNDQDFVFLDPGSPRSIIEYNSATKVRVIESNIVMGGFRFKGRYKNARGPSFSVTGDEFSPDFATNMPFAMTKQLENWYAVMACADNGDAAITPVLMPFLRAKSIASSVVTLGGAGEGVEFQGAQRALFSATFTGATATGLANDATVYTASISVDGTPNAIAVTGSAAQTYTTLVAEINTDLSGATIKIQNLNGGTTVLETESTLTGKGVTTTIAITDTDLFSTLTLFSSIETATTGIRNANYDWTVGDLANQNILVISETVAGRANSFAGRITTITSVTSTTVTLGTIGDVAALDWLLPAPEFDHFRYCGAVYMDTEEVRNIADSGTVVKSRGIFDFGGTNTGAVAAAESRNASGYISPLATAVIINSSGSLSTASTGQYVEHLGLDSTHDVSTMDLTKALTASLSFNFPHTIPFSFGTQYFYRNAGALDSNRVSGQQNIYGWIEP